jgi:hypothetical protein
MGNPGLEAARTGHNWPNFNRRHPSLWGSVNEI